MKYHPVEGIMSFCKNEVTIKESRILLLSLIFPQVQKFREHSLHSQFSEVEQSLIMIGQTMDTLFFPVTIKLSLTEVIKTIGIFKTVPRQTR